MILLLEQIQKKLQLLQHLHLEYHYFIKIDTILINFYLIKKCISNF